MMLQEAIEKGVDLETARWQARVDLAAAHRVCVMHGFNEGIFNHLTYRVPGTNDRYYQIPFGLYWSEVVSVAPGSGSLKLGQPVPISNFFFDTYSFWLQPAQVNVPERFS